MLIGGVVVSIFVFNLLRQQEQSLVDAELTRRADILTSALQTGIDGNVETIQSIGNLYAAAPDAVGRNDFREFVSRPLLQHREVVAFAWVPRVTLEERTSIEEAARGDGLTDMQVTELGDQNELLNAPNRAEYFPMFYVEPIAENERLLGFNLASSQSISPSLDLARDSPSMVATGIEGVAPVFRFGDMVIIRPIYQRSAPLETLEERRQNLTGYAVGVVSVSEMLENSVKDVPFEGVDFQVFETAGVTEGQLLHVHQSGVQRVHQSGAAIARPRSIATEDALETGAELGLPGRILGVTFFSKPEDLGRADVQTSLITLIGGLLIAALLAAYMVTTSRHTARVEQLVADLFKANEDLEREMDERRKAEEARIELLSQTALALAHHVRNSLTPIIGLAQLYTGDNLESAKLLRDTALEKGRRIAAIIDALAEIAESGEVPVTDALGLGPRRMLDMEALIERHMKGDESEPSADKSQDDGET